jgi:hypothetical protein
MIRKTEKRNKLRILRREVKSNMEGRNCRASTEDEKEEDGKKKGKKEAKLCELKKN